MKNGLRPELITRTSGLLPIGQTVQQVPQLPGAIELETEVTIGPLGASMRTAGAFAPGTDQQTASSLLEWSHQISDGRDICGRSVAAGVLYPFGHRATFENSFRRVITFSQAGVPIAALVERLHVHVTGPVLPFSRSDLPFIRVEIIDATTPEIALGEQGEITLPNSEPFLFHVRMTDVAGTEHNVKMPLQFVGKGTTANVTAPIDFAGQRVTYAADGGHPGSTTFATRQIRVTASASTPTSPLAISMESAAVVIPALQHFAEVSGTSDISYLPDYVANPASARWATLIGSPRPAAKFANATQSGGLGAPATTFAGLAKDAGLACATANGGFADHAFDAFLDEARMLGGISLRALVEHSAQPPPTFTTADDGRTSTVQMIFTAQLKPFSIVAGGTLELQATATHADSPSGGTGTSLCSGTISDLELVFPPRNLASASNDGTDPSALVQVNFKEFTFDQQPGQKLAVSASFQSPPMVFQNELQLLNPLIDFLPFDGFQNPPSLNVTDSGVSMRYAVGLPEIAFGVFRLDNVALGAEIDLPFDASPTTVGFSFSTPEDPFLLAVGIFAGSGYFLLTLAADSLSRSGIRKLSASLGFGGSVALNVFVAEAGVSVIAGAALTYDTSAPQPWAFTAFLRVTGEMSVLGIASVSLDVMLSLTYANGALLGSARVELDVSLLFFHKSISFNVAYSFATDSAAQSTEMFTSLTPAAQLPSSKPPAFTELMSLPAWESYWSAFAAA